MKLLFFGSPAFAVPTLRILHGAGHSIAKVVTRPDKPRGRGRKPSATAVKRAAVELGLEVFQPASANDPESVEELRRQAAELGVVVAYGEILNSVLLALPREDFINLHASLLPDYRGAAPINWALMRGETRTGVTVIRMSAQLDEGPILAQKEVRIGQDETAGELADRLSTIGAELVLHVVKRLDARDDITVFGQPSEEGFFARKLTKEDGRIDWSLPAETIRNRVRGLTPWPGAYCGFQKGGSAVRVTLLEVRTGDEARGQEENPGVVIRADRKGIVVQTGAGTVRMITLKPSGGRAMGAADFVQGYRVKPGDSFE